MDRENRVSFWYRTTRPNGAEFMVVDAERGTREPAFDHVRLAASLSNTSGSPYEALRLPFDTIELIKKRSAVQFALEGVIWTCDLKSYACVRGGGAGEEPADAVRSPDGKWDAFVRDHNLFVRSVDNGEERTLTSNGECQNGYGAPLVSPLATAGISEHEKPAVVWSPDSKKLLSCRIDERDALRFHLVQSIPADGSVRPVLHTYAYPLPGDEALPLFDIWCFEVDKGTGVKAAMAPLPMLYYGSPLSSNFIWWKNDNSSVYMLIRDRGYLSYRLVEIDTKNGKSREVVTETAETGIDPYLLWSAVSIRVLSDGSQVILYSQEDGWANLYLHDAKSGKRVRQLTSGPGNVAEIVFVDESERTCFFTAVGRQPGRDPYFSFLYRVSLVGGEPKLLTPEDAEHSVVFSPIGQVLC